MTERWKNIKLKNLTCWRPTRYKIYPNQSTEQTEKLHPLKSQPMFSEASRTEWRKPFDLEKVEKTLKQIKYAATNHNHKINATGQNIRCLTGGPEQMNISGVTSMIKHSWQFLLVSLCFRPYDCKVIVSVYNGCCNKTGTHKHTNNNQHSHKTKPNKTKALH